MEPAPFYSDIAEGPEGGAAWWLTAADGLRLRIAVWNAAPAPKGTVLIFPGRTEYAEKYGRLARELAARGYASLSVDWRGQGLADRLIEDDTATGHVHWFADYQLDVQAVVEAARALNLPEPFYLIAHSMGGCIGLRALHNGLPVRAACFTAPMWGIGMAPAMRPTAWAIAWGGTLMGLGKAYAPGTDAAGYVSTADFEDNTLTRDRDMWDYMKRHLEAHPELLLGGPSLRWLREALRECRALSQMPAPPQPAIAFLGTNERIVHPPAIYAQMARWPNGHLEVLPEGEHEVLMESPEKVAALLGRMEEFFAAAP